MRIKPARRVGLAAVVALFAVGFVFAQSAGAFKIRPGDNVQQSPVAGDPQCSDLFPGSTQVRSDPPGRDINPTGTVPAQVIDPVTFVYSDSGHHVIVTIDGWNELVGVIVHGGASGSNVYDSSTGMSGRLISTLNPGGGLDEIHYTLACYTPHQQVTSSTTTTTAPAQSSTSTTTAAPTTSVVTTTTDPGTQSVVTTTTDPGTQSVVTTTTDPGTQSTPTTSVVPPASSTPAEDELTQPPASTTSTVPTQVLPGVEVAQPASPVPGQPTFTG